MLCGENYTRKDDHTTDDDLEILMKRLRALRIESESSEARRKRWQQKRRKQFKNKSDRAEKQKCRNLKGKFRTQFHILLLC